MLVNALAVMFLAAVVVAAAASDLDTDWEEFKAMYNKTYSTDVDELRKMIWLDNRKIIEEHNKLYAQGLSTFFLGENRLADMTVSEITSMLTGLQANVNEEELKEIPTIDTSSFPPSIDWRRRGYVTHVQDQGSCNACWAFSATGAIEGQHFRSTHRLVDLSESNLVDCSRSYGNRGCSYGRMVYSFRYIIGNGGIDTDASYPYRGRSGRCDFHKEDIGATISNFRQLPVGSESALLAAVAEIGPISVGIDGNHPSFFLYKGGVYDEPTCTNSSSSINHALLVVGYGTYHSRDYWLVKNSWGQRWGLDGYIMMSRNKNNQCGIASQASYPIILTEIGTIKLKLI